MVNAFELAKEQIREIVEASNGTVVLEGDAIQPDGSLQLDVSIRFDGLEQVENGLRVRAREEFSIFVPPTFPFQAPSVYTPHTRFSGFRHVQWGKSLCLYGSSTDWRPEDGMYGFIRQLDSWIRDAALNNLDPNDAPLHPPVAYPTVGRVIVSRADTPVVGNSPWFGFAELQDRNHRAEIIDWKEHDQEQSGYFAPAILLHKELPFEYPKTVRDLLKELESHGIDYAPFILKLSSYAQVSSTGTPLTVVLGAPMRRVVPGGRMLQHLAVWEISADDADKLRALNASAQVRNTDQRNAAIKEVVEWSVSAKVGWCIVHEMRPEVTRRRDHASPMAWFYGKSVAIWGCGAVGSHVAESVVRAGVKTVELVDNNIVTPGLLVRQAFEDADIGRNKAKALKDRLKRIEPELEVTASTDDLIFRITNSVAIPEVDLIIDCTASLAVRTALEHALQNISSRPAIASMAIDSRAKMAIATLSNSNHSGGPLDLIRRLKLEACREPALSRVLEAFWPKTIPSERFQPEPGCSEPTFVGSNADLAGLSARVINSIARAISTPKSHLSGAGWLFEELGPVYAFAWPRDYVLQDEGRGHSVRVCSHAAREMRGWARRSARTAGKKVETGGLVFGELNEAAGVLWVTEVEGPPPDSHATEDQFTCGTEGTEEAAEEKRVRFRRSVVCVGSWHTHPTSAPHPSDVDINAVAQLLGGLESTRKTCLILILSGDPDNPILGAHVFRTRSRKENHLRIQQNAKATMRFGPQPQKTQNVGLALSGGGSRAIAFHLGCLRALSDLDLLDRVQVISSVSGGSIISAMYAYSSESFQEFDARVVQLLRRGLHRAIFLQVLKPGSIWKALKIRIIANTCLLIRMLCHLVDAVVRSNLVVRLGPPPMRTFSRTEAFRGAIAESLFGNTLVRDIARDSLHTVINATELRTSSAFRFGSRESGCWRFGTIAPEDALLADAVAASAAYPVWLPALDRKYRFTKNGYTGESKRVVLTDGGVFENLGVSPMEPGRTSSVSTNVFDPDYIICCDAGAGLFDDDSHPTRWPTRMYRSFLTVFRKVQDASRKRLHSLADDKKISGFALCYLGQQDRALPRIPAGLPKRNEVKDYPTDFAPMSAEDVDRLALRGELLTRFLISYYLPHL